MNLYKYNRKSLEIQKINLTQFVIPIVSILFIFVSIGSAGTYKVIKEEIPVIYKTKELKFSEKLLKEEIKSMNLPHKDIILCQIRLETGNYTSQVFKLNNNLVGMKYSPSRINLQEGEDMGFARYSDWSKSLEDYAIYLSLYCRGLDDSEFIQFLDEVYCPNQNYANRIKELLKQNNGKYRNGD